MAGRVAIATSLASGLADAGDMVHARDAVALAQRIASPATTRLVQRVELGMITGALAETGQYREAMNILSDLVQDSPAPAVTMSASAISKATVAEAERYRVTTLCSLAIVQAKLGDRAAAAAILKKAKQAADKVRRGYPAAFARARIAEAWAEAGEFAMAEKITAALAHPILRAQGFWKIGAAKAAIGDTAEAQRLERLALEETQKIPSLFDRTIMLGDSAASRARAGRGPEAQALVQRALELGHSIEDAWWRSRAFAHLARALHVLEEGAPG
jgi:tetratricopeptide (TPR) repeat protein